jgi:hypothetical protein
MELHGLVVIERQALPNDVIHYVLEADPDLAIKGVRNQSSWQMPHPYGLASQAIEFRNLAALREDFPYLYVLTDDVPSDARVDTHMDVVGGLIDTSFMKRFRHRTIHIDYNRHPKVFRFGPKLYSRLFDIGLEDITYRWKIYLNDVMLPISYILLFASRRVSLAALAGKMDRCRSRAEFDSRVLDLVEVIAYVYEDPHIYLFTKNRNVISRIDGSLPQDLSWKLRDGTSSEKASTT